MEADEIGLFKCSDVYLLLSMHNALSSDTMFSLHSSLKAE